MDRLYVRTKLADQRTAEEQFCRIIAVFNDVFCTKDPDKRDIRLARLEDSIQTYFDIREKQGIDIDSVRRQIMEYNKRRGYYYE